MAINAKRIARNTGFLYARLLLVMGVNLYAARVVLEVLGATDYGLYYAIFGVIGLLSFLNSTLSSGTSRFITYELGKGSPEQLKKTFETTLVAHGLLCGIILILGETVGLWYATHILVIPPEHTSAALIVYQTSVISTIFTIIQVPFTAEIIAHERMNVYAYLGIFEAVAKLIVVYLLLHTGFNKLVFYAWLQFGVVFLVMAFNMYYSFTRFSEVSFRLWFDKSILKSILKFSGWNIIANISETLMSQGVIMLYNYFFLPVVVASQAISNQIAHALSQLINNVRQAINPQVIKLYADKRHDESKKLTLVSAEYIFYILLLFGVPCIMVMPSLLNLWLVEVPEYAVAFARLIIVQQILGNFSAAFYTPMLAANKIAKNSIASVFLCILQFGVLWIMFYYGFGPLWARYLGILSAVIFSLVVKPYILWKDVNYSLKELYTTILKCLKTLFFVVVANVSIYVIIGLSGELKVWLCGVLSFVSILLICVFNIDKKNRDTLWNLLLKKLRH